MLIAIIICGALACVIFILNRIRTGTFKMSRSVGLTSYLLMTAAMLFIILQMENFWRSLFRNEMVSAMVPVVIIMIIGLLFVKKFIR